MTDGQQTAQANLSITVWQQLEITTASLPDAYEGDTGYWVQLTATGGNSASYAWNMSGTLPSGLSWDAAGATISGDVAQGTAGDYPLQFELTDGIQTVTANLVLTIRARLRITTTTLPDAYDGQTGYSAMLTATGGTGSYTWSLASGSLPPFLTFDASGLISGNIATNASANSPYNFTVQVTDGVETKQANLSITVTAAPPPLQITTTSLPDATQRVAYSYTVTATGGNPSNYNWSVSGQPWWLAIDATTGELSGTPPAGSAGTHTFTVSVTDGQQTASKQFDLTVQTGAGKTWYVDGVNGSDLNTGTSWSQAFATIGKALSVAGSGDTILVADATYYETDLDFSGKGICLRGVDHHTGGLTRPVIDCQNGGRAFYFGSGEGEDSIVDNFVIQNGDASSGGAIRCSNSSNPTIRNCVFTGNRSSDTGGAICCETFSNPTIIGCVFSGNSAYFGGAVYCYSSSPTITNCLFRGNSADWYGGALRCYSYSSPTVTNCTFSGNSADDGGAVACYTFSNPTLNNSILWSNSASFSGDEVYIYDIDSSCTLNHCCVDNTGYGGQTGNITENDCIHQNPQFVDAANDDYHLKSNSPCIDGGDNTSVPAGVTTDLDGNQRIVDGNNDGTATVDIGAYEYQSSAPPLQITTTSLPDATEGVAYSYTVTATGGDPGNYDWSMSGQPWWLTINSATGELSGTPPVGSAGTYTFTVSVTDGQQTASKQFDLTVQTGGGSTTVRADFKARPIGGKVPLTVNFTDKSTGTITQWQWDFDNDGTVDSTDQNPSWTYNNAGWYTVKLTVTGPAGSDSRVRRMYILAANNIWYVNGVGGSDRNGGTGWRDAFKTIGKALSVAGDYDLVLVADAEYNETDLNFNGKKVYLRGVVRGTGGKPPVIDCQQAGRAFYFGSGETVDCVVDNFTIRGGSATDGGAIRCRLSSPTIINCTFIGNSAIQHGGAIHCSSSNPSIVRCTFSGNSAEFGGAIYCNLSSPTVSNCIFSRNRANSRGGAIRCFNTSIPTITNCTFIGNSAEYGGALCCWNFSSSTLTNCSFSNNSAQYGGAIECENLSSATLNNSVLWHNTAGASGNEICVRDSGSLCALSYCCVDNTGYGGVTSNITESNCIHSNPKFVCAGAGLLRLKHDSPCIDAGDNTLVPAGVATDIMGCRRIVGSSVDIGAYEVQGIVYVDGVGGDDANSGVDWSNALKTIGAGLSAADDGWIVVVADATYNETNLKFNGKKIHLEGADYYTTGAQPVIDCQQAGAAFNFASDETEESIVDNFTIKNGKAHTGGAVYCESSSPSIVNCVFSSNRGNNSGGVIYCSAGSPLIVNCTFSDNSAAGNGGAILCENSGNPVIGKCVFSGNSTSGHGGAIYCSSSSPTVIGCTFTGNSTKWRGGAIRCYSSSHPTIVNCLFSGNSADTGAALCCWLSSSPTVVNCTFSDNSARKGGAIECESFSNPILNNCILWRNSASGGGNEIYAAVGCTVTLNYCCVDNRTGDHGGSGTINDSNNCLHRSPQFVNAANSNYHLKPTSPCIDAGDDSLLPSAINRDLDGNPRIVDGNNDGTPAVDIGAYEKQ